MSLLPHASGCAQHPLRDTDLVVSSCAQQDDIKGARRRELACYTDSSVGGMRAPESTPEQFLCPITLEIMRDPVVASDEHTYERLALVQWLQHQSTSPVTRQPLQSDFRRNHALRQLIENWEQQASAQQSKLEVLDRGAQRPGRVSAEPRLTTDAGYGQTNAKESELEQLEGLQPQVLNATVENLPQLVSSLQDLSHPADRDQAASAICSMTSDSTCRQPIAEMALQGLTNILQDPASPAGRVSAAGALANLAKDPSLRKAIADAALPALVDMLGQGAAAPQGSIHAAAALRQLSAEQSLKVAVAAAALPVLAEVLQKPGSSLPDVEANVSATLWQLAADKRLASRVASAALPALAHLVHAASSRASRCLAAGTLCQLASAQGVQRRTAEAALPALVGVLKSGGLLTDADLVRLHAARAVAHMSVDPQVQPSVASTALSALLAVLDPASPQGSLLVACTVARLADAPKLQQSVADAALPALVRLLQDCTHPQTQAIAAAALGRLAISSSRHLRCQVLFQAGDALDCAARAKSNELLSDAATIAVQQLHAGPARLLQLRCKFWCRARTLNAMFRSLEWLESLLEKLPAEK